MRDHPSPLGVGAVLQEGLMAGHPNPRGVGVVLVCSVFAGEVMAHPHPNHLGVGVELETCQHQSPLGVQAILAGPLMPHPD